MRNLLLSPVGVAVAVVLYTGLILGLLWLSDGSASLRVLIAVLVGLTGGVPFGYMLGRTRSPAQTRDSGLGPLEVPVWTVGRVILTALMIVGFLAFIAMVIVLAMLITPP